MAFAAANVAATSEPRAFSLGPIKCQLMSYTVASGDTSGTITADGLSTISHVQVSGAAGIFSAVPTYSGNVATITFVNPLATRQGAIMVFGK